MKRSRYVLTGMLAAGMMISLTGCYEERPAYSTSSYYASSSEDSAGTSVVTTTYDTDPAVIEVVGGGAAASLDDPDLEVTRRLKWMAWWDIDETTAAAEMFKVAYGIPEEGDDPASEGRIFEYIKVAYDDRYDKLTEAIQSGNSPDLFPFEMRDFPYGVVEGRYQPVDKILNLNGSKWDAARGVLDQFRLNGRYYCAVYEVSFDSLLYYRKSVIEEAGLQDPRALFENGKWTWDTFLDMAREFQKTGDGKYVIEGYNSENDFLVSTGTPLIGNNGTKLVNNMYSADVERAMDFLSTLQKEDLRYPFHELNSWNVNIKAWAQGDILFYGNGGMWEFEDDHGLNRYVEKFGWEPDDICVVPYPKDPKADKYYHMMKNDAYMWCKGSTNSNGVAAWIDCNITSSLDPAVKAASMNQIKEKNGWSDYNLDFIYSQTALDGTSRLTPVFDFKNGIGADIADASKSNSAVESVTKSVYLTGTRTYDKVREEKYSIINDRVDEINDTIASLE